MTPRPRVVVARYLPAAGSARLAERYDVDEDGAQVEPRASS